MNWISVKDRLPEEDGFYLVGGGDERGRVVDILYYDSKSEKFKGHWAEKVFDVSDVTHWMPLPEPPDADYLLENGVIVPIFQIGEKVFVIDTDDEIRERTVSALFFRKKVCVVYTCGSGILGTVYEQSHPKGAGLYRTREEAEKALKEAQNG